MGDRCSLSVYVTRDDRDRMVEILGEPESETIESPAKLCCLEYSEANYGMCDELDQAAEERLRFYAMHGAGDNYGPSTMASDSQQAFWVECDWDGQPVVAVPVIQQDLDKAQEVVRMVAKLRGEPL